MPLRKQYSYAIYKGKRLVGVVNEVNAEKAIKKFLRMAPASGYTAETLTAKELARGE